MAIQLRCQDYAASCGFRDANGLRIRGHLSPCPKQSPEAEMGQLRAVPAISLLQVHDDPLMQIMPRKGLRFSTYWCDHSLCLPRSDFYPLFFCSPTLCWTYLVWWASAILLVQDYKVLWCSIHQQNAYSVSTGPH